MKAYIKAIHHHLPENLLTTDDLAREFPEWNARKIETKTGIRTRRLASGEECSSDLAVEAARKLFASGVCDPGEVDFLILCTQTPDYALPSTSCLVQRRLGLPTSCGAFDLSLGCSAYIYGLGTAKGLIETGQAKNVLLLTAETYSKIMHPRDKTVRTIFGDGAAATLLSAGEEDALGPFVYGTDGRGAMDLVVRGSGMRALCPEESRRDSCRTAWPDHNLFMDGAKIYKFVMNLVPGAVASLIAKAGLTWDEVDRVVFHQANAYILDKLQKAMTIPEEKYILHMAEVGNTVSSTIPLALAAAVEEGRIRSGQTLLLAGFGVGYSWGGCILRWS